MMALEFELVLPCYNEARSLAFLVERAKTAAAAAGYTPQTFQLVLVENGSKDNSREVVKKLAESELGSWFRVVPVSPNEGYGNGLWQGLKTTSAQYVGWSHADQQCDPKDAFQALQLLKTSPNPEKTLVKGVRHGRNWKDFFVSRVFEIFTLFLLKFRIFEINAQPKVFPRTLLREIVAPPKGFEFDLYVLYRARKAGFSFQTISVLFPPRVHGVSNWAANFFSRYKTIGRMIAYMASLGREHA